ncbi:hypothetical protein KUTeg_013534 [Tegillarca granosa]|uniref:Uncharacterized protein n=1 Tax=Tegillarca granosa TaxID=220873 RepID=A0ABQ9EU15_TEGGR|nr:hypothetical protein KUTeg_013534 [Tegillarca granosa]
MPIVFQCCAPRALKTNTTLTVSLPYMHADLDFNRQSWTPTIIQAENVIGFCANIGIIKIFEKMCKKIVIFFSVFISRLNEEKLVVKSSFSSFRLGRKTQYVMPCLSLMYVRLGYQTFYQG